ncbi:ZmpA/ZmpB/ZmpC family metallo-endopeptidase [Mycoplasma sp. 1654_15]|uniref:ZmpA/ZmpB/ZmpC family metallo-endopeptidase n=1 Tax=Mycoplasma sp. 1654_15 TaxID=2725994 RepID=UPI00144945E1|nr:ZmpA/ZmpB/ZmpC family metallo-endopeptidase [Mycoplasma sp. 1654_15]QJB71130.1 hypothetical protein HF996_01300 [Mycoplasma sp. 1654_15]
MLFKSKKKKKILITGILLTTIASIVAIPVAIKFSPALRNHNSWIQVEPGLNNGTNPGINHGDDDFNTVVEDPVVIDRLPLDRPEVILSSVDNHIKTNNSQLDFNIIDRSQSFKSLKVEIFEDDKLIFTQEETKQNNDSISLKAPILSPKKKYRVVYLVTYFSDDRRSKTKSYTKVVNLNFKPEEEKQPPTDTQEQPPQKINIETVEETITPFAVSDKKALKINKENINKYTLFRVDEDDHLIPINFLNERPRDITNYFVKVYYDNQNASFLKVNRIFSQNNSYFASVDSVNDQLKDKNGKPQNLIFKLNEKNNNQNIENSIPVFSFADLIDKVSKNPDANFIVKNDLTATDPDSDKDRAYILEEFKGHINFNNNTIIGLKLPLFDKIKDATIENLNAVEIGINSNAKNVGTIVNSAKGSVIRNVYAEGTIAGFDGIGGILAFGKDTKIYYSHFEGSIFAKDYINSENISIYFGGLVSELSGPESTVENSSANVKITTIGTTNNSLIRQAGLVGRLIDAARVTKSMSFGKLFPSKWNAYSGGLVATTWQRGKLDHSISLIDATKYFRLHGDDDYTNNWDIKEIYGVKEYSKGRKGRYYKEISVADLASKMKGFGIVLNQNVNVNNYLNKEDKIANNLKNQDLIIKYNLEKLLPFYDSAYINFLAKSVNKDSNIAKKLIKYVINFKDDKPIYDDSEAKTLNKIKILYQDKSVDYKTIEFKSDFENIAEYYIDDFKASYTPYALNKQYKLNPARLESLKNLSYNNIYLQYYFNITADKFEKLFYEDSFNEIKNKIEGILNKILFNEFSQIPDSQELRDAIFEKVYNNKEKLLFAISYINRWYDFNVDDLNVKDVLFYAFNYFSDKKISVLDWLISIANYPIGLFTAQNNLSFFDSLISPYVGGLGLYDFLESIVNYGKTSKVDMNQWLIEHSKVNIQEAKLTEPDAIKLQEQDPYRYSTKLWYKMQLRGRFSHLLLILLTMKQTRAYLVTSVSGLTFGMYETYAWFGNKPGDVPQEQIDKDIKRIDALVKEHTEAETHYYNYWWRVLSPQNRLRLVENIYTSDTLFVSIPDPNHPGRGTRRYIQDQRENYKNVVGYYQFLGPAINWRNTAPGTSAVSWGDTNYFTGAELLYNWSQGIYTHEMTHSLDGRAYFNGLGRREGLYGEVFASGLLESAVWVDTHEGIALNTVKTDTSQKSQDRRIINYSPDIFKNATDLRNYFKHEFDLIYLMEIAETEIFSEMMKDPAKKEKLRDIFMTAITNPSGANVFEAISKEKWSQMHLDSIDDFVDNDIMLTLVWEPATIRQNWYYFWSLPDSLYGTADNPQGSPGDITLKRFSYELLGEFGWDNGFVPYLSNQYKKFSPNKKLSDNLVFEHLFEKTAYEGKTVKEFKKLMYKQRSNKKDLLKPVSIIIPDYNPKGNNVFPGNKFTVNNYQELKNNLKKAIEYDLDHNSIGYKRRNRNAANSSVWKKFKKAMINGYLKSTNDFKTSIFKENEEK